MAHTVGLARLHGEYVDMAGGYLQHPIVVVEKHGMARVERYPLRRAAGHGRLSMDELVAGEPFTHSLATSFA